MRELHDLLASCFSSSELRRFIRYLPDGDRLCPRLPDQGVSLAGLVEDVVELLDREGALDVGFFDALAQVRPRRETEVRAVQETVLQRLREANADRTIPMTSEPARISTLASSRARVFLSYVRLKDLHNEVADFRDRLGQELGLRLDGKPEDIFLDTQSILPGQPWEAVIDAAVDQASALVVLMSPAYLKREWCRREFENFSARIDAAGRVGRVFPVIWLPTSAPGDAVFDGVMAHNAVDWTDLRFESWEHPGKRRAMSMLAEAIAASILQDSA